jgi:hypothetical protein
LRQVSVLFRDTQLFDECESMPIGRGFGFSAPDARLEPHDFNVFGGGLIDVSRYCVRPPKDHDEVDRAGNISQLGGGRQASHVGTVWAYRNDVIPCRPEVIRNRIAVPRWV